MDHKKLKLQFRAASYVQWEDLDSENIWTLRGLNSEWDWAVREDWAVK